MRTGRSLTVLYRSLLPGGGGLLSGDLLLGGSAPRVGGLLPGGVCSGGVCSRGRGWHPSMHWGRPPLWTESQTPVKTLPWPNFVAAGNKQIVFNVAPCKISQVYPLTTTSRIKQVSLSSCSEWLFHWSFHPLMRRIFRIWNVKQNKINHQGTNRVKTTENFYFSYLNLDASYLYHRH